MRLTCLAVLAAAALLCATGAYAQAPAASQAQVQPDSEPPFGMIGKIVAKAGQRGALMALLVEGSGSMPGNLSYVVAADGQEPESIWVTETWVNRAAHDDSLKLPSVQATIAKARPLIASFSDSHLTVPVLPPKL